MENNKKFSELFNLFSELRHELFDAKIKKPMEPYLHASSSDIGIPNGPAEDSTRGLLKAHYPKNKKIRKPKILLRKVRIVIESLICNLAG